jgi:hypothetical protein
MGTTNVPVPNFGLTGFIAPLEEDVLKGVITDYQTAFNGRLNLDINITSTLSTPQGQLASSTAAIIGNVNDLFVYYTNQVDPAYAKGRMQDAIARIYFIERNPSQPTVIQVECVGLTGVVIPVGSLVQDTDGNIYASGTAGTIPLGGMVLIAFANLVPGPTAIPGTNEIAIYQAIPGWDTATVASGIVGNDVEGRDAFEERRALSTAQNSAGSLPSVLGAVLNVPAVLDAFVTENATGTAVTLGGFTIAPHSIYVAVVGGDPNAVAKAIWTRKAPGCSYNGNTSVTVYDDSSGYTPPFPAYTVLYETPKSLPILFSVNILENAQVPADIVDQIKAALIGAFAGSDGGARARIGTTIYASRYYQSLFSLGSWMKIINVQVGSKNDADVATFTGSIGGTALVVSGVSGIIAIGQAVFDTSGNVLPGTMIVGGAGTQWTLNYSQSVASETMQAASANEVDTPVNIDQVPTLIADNITVTLT